MKPTKANDTVLNEVKNLGGSIIVKYYPATNTWGSRWKATIDRGGNYKFTSTASFDYSGKGNEGADKAAYDALNKFTAFCKKSVPNISHQIKGKVTIGQSVYAYIFE